MLFPFGICSKKPRCPFTHSSSQIDTVVKYILLQEEHHKKKPFKEEYLEMLEKNNVAFEPEYLFEFFSDIYE